MGLSEAILLGVIQGLTEFLPVSSSGHLVIAQSFIKGFSQPGVLFDVTLHMGTLFAVLWYFRSQIIRLNREMLFLLAIGTVPAALVGILFVDFLEGLFLNPRLVGIALLVTGVMNWIIDESKKQNAPVPSGTGQAKRKTMSWRNALWIGVFQAVAIIPGISRSGSTIFAGVFAGIKKEDAAVFSFLLSVPAVLGAMILQILSHGPANEVDIPLYLAGAVVAFVIGYLSIGILMQFLVKRRFRIFAVYSLIVGAGTILLTLY